MIEEILIIVVYFYFVLNICNLKKNYSVYLKCVSWLYKCFKFFYLIEKN